MDTASRLNYIFIVLFVVFFMIAIVSLTSVFLSINTVYSTFNLIVVFFTTSLILFLLDFEFIAIVYTTVYVGAISIFFIFILMTINIRFEDSSEYKDEIYFDKNFSFFVLLGFSFLIQNMFFIEFKNLLYFKKLVEYRSFFRFKSFFDNSKFGANKGSVTTNIDQSELGSLNNFFADSFFNYSLTTSYKLDVYSDINLIGLNLYDDMQVIFLLLTYILLFSMLASIGFAMRSK